MPLSMIIFTIISVLRTSAVAFYYRDQDVNMKKYFLALVYAGYTPLLLHLLLDILNII